jgi:hypothetical protein
MSATATAHPKRPLSRRLQAALMRVINVPMRLVLGLPIPTPMGNRLMLVFLTGRKTGRSYRQPVSYVRHGNTLLTPGGGNWKLNLLEGQPTRIRLRGRDLLVRPEIVRDVDEIERLLEIMTNANRMVQRFVSIPGGPDGRFDRSRLETAVRYGFRTIRWHLNEPQR